MNDLLDGAYCITLTAAYVLAHFAAIALIVMAIGSVFGLLPSNAR